MKIYILTNRTASKVWRLLPQARYMQQLGHEVIIDEYAGQIEPAKLRLADLVITQMVFDYRILYALHEYNTKIIFEVDDMQEVTHRKHYAYKDTSGITGLRRRWYIYNFMKYVDAIITTNERLKKHYNWITKIGNPKKIFVLPNYLDLSYWQQLHIPNETGKIRMVWAGGSSHGIDLEWIAPVIKKVLKKYPNLQFVYMGYGGWSEEGNPFTEFLYGEDVFKDIPKDQLICELGTGYLEYPKKLSLLLGDFGIAPVVKNTFSKCKTPIKAMEYGINYMPTIGSSFLYKDVIIDGVTGKLANTRDDFYKAICEFVDNMPKTKGMGEAAYNHVKNNYDIAPHLAQWKQVFESVL